MEVVHWRIQHGVGQGSFHSASVDATEPSGRRHRFDYVYDCGALEVGRPTKALRRSVERVSLEDREESPKNGVLDVLVLSHFDQDHMNGAQDFARSCKVNRIVVPYLGPEELAFVIASQAEAISDATVAELHSLATGGGLLWGASVTMVQRVPDRDDRRDPSVAPDLGHGPENGAPSQEAVDGPPKSMEIIVDGTELALSHTMSDQDDMIVNVGAQGIWRLRFWNRGLDKGLTELVINELKRHGFPVEALSDSVTGAATILQWLAVKANRDIAIEAYRAAIATHQPNWKDEAHSLGLANFLSLGMYAGPMFNVENTNYEYFRAGLNDACSHHLICSLLGVLHQEQPVGWLGTGDAPLGEPPVWNDFAQHYTHELAAVGTVLVPHHGAAPAFGPRYYNPGLNHRRGVVAVISYGVANTYGHPRTSVITQILAAEGQLQTVTEESHLGIHEVYKFRSKR